MESEPKLFGRLTPEDKEDINQEIVDHARRGLEFMDGEIEKSEEFLRFIGMAGEYLNEELTLFKLETVAFDPQRIHLLSSEDFDNEFEDSEVNGIYRDLSDGIYLKNNESRLQLYKSALHEMVHQASYASFYASSDAHVAQRIRTGYAAHNPIEKHHEHFRGFNEGITDIIVKRILSKHSQEIIKALNLTEVEQHEPVNWYKPNMDIIELMVKKIAEENNENPESVMGRFVRGEFSGKMMHLRDVEKTFSKGSLRMLASMESGTKGDEATADKKMLEYFKSDDEALRDRIAKEVLVERERLRYDQRKGPKKKKSSWMSFFGSIF